MDGSPIDPQVIQDILNAIPALESDLTALKAENAELREQLKLADEEGKLLLDVKFGASLMVAYRGGIEIEVNGDTLMDKDGAFLTTVQAISAHEKFVKAKSAQTGEGV
jgi:hypothetical protein